PGQRGRQRQRRNQPEQLAVANVAQSELNKAHQQQNAQGRNLDPAEKSKSQESQKHKLQPAQCPEIGRLPFADWRYEAASIQKSKREPDIFERIVRRKEAHERGAAEEQTPTAHDRQTNLARRMPDRLGGKEPGKSHAEYVAAMKVGPDHQEEERGRMRHCLTFARQAERVGPQHQNRPSKNVRPGEDVLRGYRERRHAHDNDVSWLQMTG